MFVCFADILDNYFRTDNFTLCVRMTESFVAGFVKGFVANCSRKTNEKEIFQPVDTFLQVDRWNSSGKTGCWSCPLSVLSRSAVKTLCSGNARSFPVGVTTGDISCCSERKNAPFLRISPAELWPHINWIFCPPLFRWRLGPHQRVSTRRKILSLYFSRQHAHKVVQERPFSAGNLRNTLV